MKKKIALLQGGFNGEVMKYAIRGIRKRIQEEGLIFIYSVVMAEKKKICCTIRESIRFFHY